MLKLQQALKKRPESEKQVPHKHRFSLIFIKIASKRGDFLLKWRIYPVFNPIVQWIKASISSVYLKILSLLFRLLQKHLLGPHSE